MNSQRSFPYKLATRQHRLGGRAVELGLYIVTLGIGWFIWNLIVWTDGRTPGHQVLKMRVYSTDTGKPASWGHMALRQFVLPLSFGLVPLVFIIVGAIINNSGNSVGAVFFGLGYLIGFAIALTDIFWIFKGDKNQRLVDVFARTTVLNECVTL